MLQSHHPSSLTHLLTTVPASLTVPLPTTQGCSILLHPPMCTSAWWMEKNTMLREWGNDEDVIELEGVDIKRQRLNFLSNLFEDVTIRGKVRSRWLIPRVCQRPFTLHHYRPFNTTELKLVRCLLSWRGKTFAFSKRHLDQKNVFIFVFWTCDN